MIEETLFKAPYTFFSEKCTRCYMQRRCLRATAFAMGDRNYLLSLHHRKRRVTEAMLAGKKAHEEMELATPTVDDAFPRLVEVLRKGGSITLKEVPVHSVLLGLRGVIDRLTISFDGSRTYDIVVEEFKSHYWRPYFGQVAIYGLILFSHDAEILTRLPIEERLKRLSESGVKVEEGVLSLLKRIRTKVVLDELIEHLVKYEGWVNKASVKRLYAEGRFRGRTPSPPVALPIYPSSVTSPDVSIKANLIILTGKRSVFPIDFCRHNVLSGFGSTMKKAVERRLKSARRWHRTLVKGLYELESLPYCRECGASGEKCHYPEYCLIHPPGVKEAQMHFSGKTGAVVKTGPPRVL
ncbi:MAG: hypothetical protein JRN45_00530 [Nitrososphaerota archaeon]|nr:hypothetical protein [Nitrososphaerota archaeon]